MTSTPPPRADRYVPDHGDVSYDVTHYDVALSYRIDSTGRDARAAHPVVARIDLAEVRLALSGLAVRKVDVVAKPAVRYSTKLGKLVVRSRKVIEAGTNF